MSSTSIMLEVKDLTKKFGSFYAVKNLNFQIKKGEIFGFLGPNGAGKTTTMRMITCFIPPTSGKILVDGHDTLQDSLYVRSKIGYLPENNPLYNDLTVSEYLNFVAEIRGIKNQKKETRIKELFNVCGLTKMANRQIGKLSKGYRQRVGLAQAMIHDPDLLILDEPTSGLDPNQIIEIRNLIKKIGREKTVIYCSHILSEVSATCDKILIINEGTIVAGGTPEELTTRAVKGNRYIVKVKAERTELENSLRNLNSVSSVIIDEVSGEWVKAEVIVKDKEEIGEEIFKCIVAKGWSLSELRHEVASLEEVFTQ
ncbi:MAG: ATP-binding cassette domain-containing protein, partial [Chitinispirillaceae bacterium]|nr:ATP-binding cassette domain-containing protein [Chitinispirillaceae bacterium]